MINLDNDKNKNRLHNELVSKNLFKKNKEIMTHK